MSQVLFFVYLGVATLFGILAKRVHKLAEENKNLKKKVEESVKALDDLYAKKAISLYSLVKNRIGGNEVLQISFAEYKQIVHDGSRIKCFVIEVSEGGDSIYGNLIHIQYFPETNQVSLSTNNYPKIIMADLDAVQHVLLGLVSDSVRFIESRQMSIVRASK